MPSVAVSGRVEKVVGSGKLLLRSPCRGRGLLPQPRGLERVSLVVEVAEADDLAFTEREQLVGMRPDLSSTDRSPADLKPDDQHLIETTLEDPQHLEPVLVEAVEPSFERLPNPRAASEGPLLTLVPLDLGVAQLHGARHVGQQLRLVRRRPRRIPASGQLHVFLRHPADALLIEQERDMRSDTFGCWHTEILDHRAPRRIRSIPDPDPELHRERRHASTKPSRRRSRGVEAWSPYEGPRHRPPVSRPVCLRKTEGEGFEPSDDQRPTTVFEPVQVRTAKPLPEPSRRAGGTSGGTKTGRCPCKHPCDSSWAAPGSC